MASFERDRHHPPRRTSGLIIYPTAARRKFATEPVVGSADRLYRHACTLGLEGIICKRANAPYRAGLGSSWAKVKCDQRDDLIVVGWTLPARSRVGLGGLPLAYYDPEGRLQYAGGVGNGFDDRELARLRSLLDTMTAPGPPPGLVYAGE